MKTRLNEQESLQLITEMINQARNNFQKSTGNSLIFWGYAIAALSMTNYFLLRIFHTPFAFSIWALTIPLFILTQFYYHKKYKQSETKSHVDKITGNVWIGFFISVIILVCVSYSFAIGLKSVVPYSLITPVIMIFSGMALYITAKLYRLEAYVYGAIIFWVGSLLCVILTVGRSEPDIQLIILAACMLCGYIIPGHIVNHKVNKDV